MELVFSSRALREICEDEAHASETLPPETVAELQDRLADIDAAESLSEIVFGDPMVDRQPPGSVQFLLAGDYELVCENNSRSPALAGDGLVDTDLVRRLKVVKIAGAES